MYIEQSDACIGIIDSDHKQIRALRSGLLSAGFKKVLSETNGTEAINFLERTDPDALILADEPIGTSTTVIPQVREFNDRLPIIVIGSIGDEDYIAQILNNGADDYLIKGRFGKKEFPARVKALLRRVSLYGSMMPTERIVQNGGLTVDFARHLVTKDGSEIDLTPTEYRILAALARNIGKVVIHQDILTRCWSSQWYDTSGHLVRVNVHRLRAKLEESGTDSRYVVVKPGVGYTMPRLTNEVE